MSPDTLRLDRLLFRLLALRRLPNAMLLHLASASFDERFKLQRRRRRWVLALLLMRSGLRRSGVRRVHGAQSLHRLLLSLALLGLGVLLHDALLTIAGRGVLLLMVMMRREGREREGDVDVAYSTRLLLAGRKLVSACGTRQDIEEIDVSLSVRVLFGTLSVRS